MKHPREADAEAAAETT